MMIAIVLLFYCFIVLFVCLFACLLACLFVCLLAICYCRYCIYMIVHMLLLSLSLLLSFFIIAWFPKKVPISQLFRISMSSKFHNFPSLIGSKFQIPNPLNWVNDSDRTLRPNPWNHDFPIPPQGPADRDEHVGGRFGAGAAIFVYWWAMMLLRATGKHGFWYRIFWWDLAIFYKLGVLNRFTMFLQSNMWE